ncbi:MAG: hypothetical protein V4541_07720 [Bacteroidota bacterium]
MKFKTTLIFSWLLLSFSAIKAQHNNIVIGPEINLPSGNSTNVSGFGMGAYLKGEIGLSEKFSLTANGGVSSFLGKKIYGPRTQTLSYLPLKAGLKYYTDNNFYLEGQLGASFGFNGSEKTALVWSPGIGSFIRSKKSNNQLDLGLRYEGWTSSRILIPSGTNYTTFGFFSLRAGYAFNL